jgi:hypothetical protein
VHDPPSLPNFIVASLTATSHHLGRQRVHLNRQGGKFRIATAGTMHRLCMRCATPNVGVRQTCFFLGSAGGWHDRPPRFLQRVDISPPILIHMNGALVRRNSSFNALCLCQSALSLFLSSDLLEIRVWPIAAHRHSLRDYSPYIRSS